MNNDNESLQEQRQVGEVIGVPPEQLLEALLFASEEPLSAAKLREIAPELADADIRSLANTLNEKYEANRQSFRIEMVANGYQMFTLPAFSSYIERLYAKRMQNRLSAKALETLAIVAYKQPITRSEIEQIRGVNVDGVMRTLLSRHLINISGTADQPGNPYLYRTTSKFLEYFGLKNLKELPRLKELDEIVESDVDVKERFGEAFLKEITPELLGLKGQEEKSDHEESEQSGEKE